MLSKREKELNENIYDFLNIWEISSLINNFKTKSFYNYLKKNNYFNLNKIKIYRALIKNDIGNYKKDIFNYDLFNLKIDNYDEIKNNILENKNIFYLLFAIELKVEKLNKDIEHLIFLTLSRQKYIQQII